MDDILVKSLGMDGWAWHWQAIVRLVLAAALGCVIGAEREHRGRGAGLRTLLLVALGSALAMVVSTSFGIIYAKAPEGIRVDPARIAYGVMVGIGFLGAGTIFRHKAEVRGLTTAAGLWCTAAIGMACGLGLFLIAIVATALVLLTLMGLFHVDKVIGAPKVKFLSVTLPIGENNVQRVSRWIRDQGVPVVDVEVNRDLSAGRETVTVEVSLPAGKPAEELLAVAKTLASAMNVSISSKVDGAN